MQSFLFMDTTEFKGDIFSIQWQISFRQHLVHNLSSLIFSLLLLYCLFSPFLQSFCSFMGNIKLHRKLSKKIFFHVCLYSGGNTTLSLRERLLFLYILKVFLQLLSNEVKSLYFQNQWGWTWPIITPWIMELYWFLRQFILCYCRCWTKQVFFYLYSDFNVMTHQFSYGLSMLVAFCQYALF